MSAHCRAFKSVVSVGFVRASLLAKLHPPTREREHIFGIRLGQYARRHLADGHAPDAAPDEIERPQWAAASVPDRPAAYSARSEPWSPDTHGTHDAICLLNSGNDSATGPARRATAFAAPSRASVSRELSVVATRQSTEKDRCGKAGSSFSSS